MAKWVNWYLRGWEYRQVQGRKRLVYVGEYYTHGVSKKTLRRLKLSYILLTVLLLAVFYAYASGSIEPNERVWSGLPTRLAQIPFLFLILAVGAFCFVREKMTYRDYRRAVVHLKAASIAAMILIGLGITGEVCTLLLGGAETANLTKECLWAAGALFCEADLAGMLLLTRRFPVHIIQRAPKAAEPEGLPDGGTHS